MDFISEYIYVVILIVGAIAQWLKSRSEKAENERVEQTIRERQAQQMEEAANAPHANSPRPAVPPPLPSAPLPGVERSPVPQLRKMGSTPPPVPGGLDGVLALQHAEMERQQAIVDRVNEFKLAKKSNPMEIVPKRKPSASRATVGTIASRLGSHRELRQAFVLKEILEKPIGLR